MLRSRFLLACFFTGSLVLAGCFGGVDFSAQKSASGYYLEEFLPSDVGMLISYSLLDEEQYSAVQNIEQKLGDVGRLSRTFSEEFNTKFKDLGLDYARDLQPAFGDQFRFVYAARMTGSDTSVTTPDTFTVATLSEPSRLQNVLQVLVDAKQMEEKTLDGRTVYVNTEDGFYATIDEDLLLMASDADNLMVMLKHDENSSLWESDAYQDALEDVGPSHVLYAMLFPANYLGTIQLPSIFTLSDIPSVIDHQALVVRAGEDGLEFQAYLKANKDRAKKADISFDQIPHPQPYLYEEVPADHLLAYYESYGLQQSLEEAEKLGGAESLSSLRDNLRSYLAMDLDEDVLTFLDKGYALALHKNGEGLFPGVTLYVDVSTDAEKAQALMDKVDEQITGLIAVFEASLPGAFIKDTVDIAGVSLSRVKVDLSAIPRTEDTPLPAAITAGPIELVYGIKDERLILSTFSQWESGGGSIAESDLYKNLSGKMEGVNQGLILVDAQELAGFVGNLRALREQLNLQVSAETDALEEFLGGFEGLMAQSHSNAYDSVFSGFLELAQ